MNPVSEPIMSPDEANAGLVDKLISIVGEDHVLADLASRTFYSRDLSFRPFAPAAAIVSPGTVDEIGKVVAAATRAGCAIVPRGGGMSYTGGYQPISERSVTIDMRRLDRVIEVNVEDMYVVVEAGCTWKTLYETLLPLGVRTPYFGPLSGMYATVGGTLSQNSLFFGSGVYRTVADSLLGLQVVLADGSLLTTGSGAHRNGNPFFRHFGPDVTGLFTADTGAFAVKAVAVLRLIPAPRATAYLSFKFDTLTAMLQAQVAIARLGIVSECYGFDPYYNKGFEKQGSTFREGVSIVGKIARKGGLRKAMQIAMGGKSILKDVAYSLHMTLDALTEGVAAEHVDLVAELCVDAGGVEMVNSIPTVFRSAPFGSVRTLLLGSDGELWLPVHGFFPLSISVAAAEATERWFAEKRLILEKWDIRTSYLTAFSGTEFVIEPSFYWHDELDDFRLSLIEPEFAERWKGRRPDLEKRKVALGLRDELRDLFDSLGGLHLQIGKYYPYLDIMRCETLPRVVQSIKDALDPEGRMNPGALGLGRAIS